MTMIRIIVAVVFFAAMAVVAKLAHIVVDLGFVPWLLAMAFIFWVGIAIENRDRAAEGRPRYSAYDAGRDVRSLAPVAAFWGVFVLIVFVVTRFI